LRIVLWAFGVVLVLIVGGLFLLYRATQHVPEFYRQAIAVDPAVQEKASDQMLRQATALASDVKKPGHWEAVFTAEQINGWLAVDLVRNHPDALPSSLRDPRVAIEPGEITLACRFQQGNASSVLTLAVEPYLAEPNVLALRFRGARAGLVPMPLSQVVDRVTDAARHTDLRLQWRQNGGDPVALISLPQPRDPSGKVVRVEVLEVRQGAVYVSGTTERQGPGS
jgi:hypothetical protein